MLNVASAKLSSLLLSLDLFLRKIGLDAQLDFFHRQFAKAVAKKYLSADSTSTHYHTWLAKYYQDKFQTTNSARAISELPFHLSGAKMVDELEATLCNLEYVQRKASLGLAFELVADFRDACNVAPSSTSIESFGKFIRSNISVIAAQPELVIQQALSSATSPPEVVASAKSLAAKSPKAKLIRWINRPESLNSSNSGHLTMMDAKTDVNDVAWSSDGSYVLSANRDGTVSIWSGQFGEELGRISGHSERVNGVAFGPSGQLFVSVAHDKKLNVYQTSSRQIIASWMAPVRNMSLLSCFV
jgi:WD40 repeat protein